jgi:hypothetical protein
MSLWSCWKSFCHTFTSPSCSLREKSGLPIFYTYDEPWLKNSIQHDREASYRFSTAILWQEQVISQWDDYDVCFVIDQHTYFDFYSTVFAESKYYCFWFDPTRTRIHDMPHSRRACQPFHHWWGLACRYILNAVLKISTLGYYSSKLSLN